MEQIHEMISASFASISELMLNAVHQNKQNVWRDIDQIEA